MSFEEIRDAIMENNIEDVEELIEANREIVNIENESRETPLYMASYFGRLDIVELLVENGARINHKDTRGGLTALTLACAKGHHHVVEYLIIEGANLNEKNNSGHTALMLACSINNGNNYLKIIGLLLDEGVDISIEDNDGHNAMYYAQHNGNEFVIQLLTNIEDARANRFTLEIIPLNKSRIPATTYDVINMEDVNIEKFLSESPANKIIKVANSFYTLNTKEIRKHYLREKHNNNYIYYPCRQTWPSRLVINREDVYFDKPLFSASYLAGGVSDFVLLNEVQAMVESGNQYFEIFINEFEDIIGTASGGMFSVTTANAVSANHCQPGKAAKILKLKMINIVEDAVEATIVKSLSKSLTEEVGSEAKAEGIRKRKTASKKKKSAKKKKKTSTKKKKSASKKKKSASKKKKSASKKKKSAKKKKTAKKRRKL